MSMLKRISSENLMIIRKYQNEIPVKVGHIANDMGIIVKKATLAAGISGEIKLVDGNVVIRVNRHDVKARQRFTLAHEIGHFLLHRDKIGDGIVDDILYRSRLSDELEAQANSLAADILMPLDKIRLYQQENSHINSDMMIQNLAEELEVSITALKIRLGKG